MPTEDDDRMICHGNQEQSRCSRLLSYIHKKLLLGIWCILVDSVKLRRMFYLQTVTIGPPPAPTFLSGNSNVFK